MKMVSRARALIKLDEKGGGVKGGGEGRIYPFLAVTRKEYRSNPPPLRNSSYLVHVGTRWKVVGEGGVRLVY